MAKIKIFVTEAFSNTGKTLIEALTSEACRDRYELCGAADVSLPCQEEHECNGIRYPVFPEFEAGVHPDVVIELGALTSQPGPNVFNNVVNCLVKRVNCIALTPDNYFCKEACLELNKYRPVGIGLLIAPAFSRGCLLARYFSPDFLRSIGVQKLIDEERQAPEKYLYVKGLLDGVDYLVKNKEFVVGLEKILF